MLESIETAILDLMAQSGVNVRLEQVGKTGAPNAPYAAVFIDSGNVVKSTMAAYRVRATVTLHMIFFHHRSERDQRKGIYNILEAVIQLLAGQDLGLDISRLVPTGFRNVSRINDDGTYVNGGIEYAMTFETEFDIVKTDADADAADLIYIMIQAYLTQPGDTDTDQEVLVTLT